MSAALDPRDLLLQAHTPVVIAPRFGELAPLEISGHRYLVARDGLWLEVRRPWLHARVPLDFCEYVLPFGELTRSIVYAFGEEDIERIQSLFLYDARAAMPDEFAAWAVYDETDRRLKYRALEVDRASPGGLEGLQRPRLEAHEHLAIDLHSHGALDAFFSSTDDDDDRGEVKVSVVVGCLDREPTWSTRLCVLGLFIGGDAEVVELEGSFDV